MNELVICPLHGRLGNILFELATALTYARKYNKDLGCVITERNNIASYPYYTRTFNMFKMLTEMKQIPANTHWFTEPLDYTTMELPNVDGKYILFNGYFQNEEYFDKPFIKELFKPSYLDIENVKAKYGDLSDYVSINVRRGSDYTDFGKYFVNPSAAWYEKCYHKYFEGRKVIITSDDIEWCKQNIHIDGAIYADKKEPNDYYTDLWTCVMCKDHIIYAGTYGWWGAWLGEKEDSKVIVPDHWWGPRNANKTENIIPERWIREELC